MKLVRYQNHPLAQAFDDFDRVFAGPFEGFGRFFDLADRPGTRLSSGRSGSGDLYEDDHHYYVRLDVPGVKKEDLKLELLGEKLVVGYESRKEGPDSRANVVSKQTVLLPEGVAADQVTAKLEDGVLTVTLPKSEERKPRTIAIN